MFLQGTVAVDPSQLTKILNKKPTKAFKKILYLLTAGMISDKEEHETFCALSILQQLYMAFSSMGINNIIHLAKDDVDFYLDSEGREDDLKEALDHFKLEVDRVEASVFQTLKLVLEHKDAQFKYLIAINVERTHRVGKFPIHIEVDGLIRDFQSKAGEDVAVLRQRMASILPSQMEHDRLIEDRQRHFEGFLYELGLALKTFIGVDQLVHSQKRALVRPKTRVHDRSRLPVQASASRPVYYGYHGTSDVFLYAFLWSEMAHDHNWHIANCSVLDESGSTMMNVGATGFDAGGSGALDPDATFEVPTGADIGLGDSSEIPGDVVSSFDSSSSDSGSSSSCSSDSGSSCSSDSGSSCGSSCGGCGGGGD